MLIPINVATDDCAFTITTRYGAMSITNLIGGGALSDDRSIRNNRQCSHLSVKR